MNEKNQKNLSEEKTDNFQDEFELMDILLILWKRKFLIIGGALACALIAIIFSYAAPKQPAVYRAYMMLEPGVINLDQNGKKNYIDSPANIKALIESGILNNRISNSGKNSSDVGNSAALKCIKNIL